MKCRLVFARMSYHMGEKMSRSRRGNIWYPKKRTSNIATWVNNRNVAQTLTNDLQAMSGGLCVILDDTHVCKEEDNFRMQLHTAHRTSMVYCPPMAKGRMSRCQKSSKCIAKRRCTYCFSDILTFIIALSSSKYTLEVFYNKVVSENAKKQ